MAETKNSAEPGTEPRTWPICPTHGAGFGVPCYMCVDADNRRVDADNRVLRARIATLETALASADPWARFGDVVFERFWSDGEPGDLEGGDLQEIARDCGLLGRTAEVDAGATHAEGCDWEPWMPLDECDCWAPMLGPYRAALRGQEG